MVQNIPSALMLHPSFNEALLSASLESSTAFIGVLSLDTDSFVYINQTGLKMLRYESLEQINQHIHKRPFRKFHNTEIDKQVRLQKVLENGVLSETNVFIKADDSSFWGEMKINYFEAEGKRFLLKRIQDVTVIKENEIKLQEVEARCEAIFMHAAIGVVLVNKQRDIILANDYAETLFGYQKNELVGQKLDVLIPQNIRERHAKLQDNYTEHPKTRPMGMGLDLSAQKKDGSLFPVEISLSFFTDSQMGYYVAFVTDVTFKKISEKKIIEKTEEVSKLNEHLENEVARRTEDLTRTMKELEVALNRERELGELKSRFVSMASHEFRTPLTTINSAASLIQKFTDTSDQEKREGYVGKIKNAIGNLTDILEEFLSVGKLEEGKIDARYTTFDLTHIVNEVQNEMRVVLKPHQKIEIKHQGVKTVFLDASLTRKILINLLSNAIKFSAEGQTITLETEVLEQIKIQVQDRGIGISAEDQKHLFDRFFRGGNVTNIQGTGLGLHIVARYTELMNGTVALESTLGTGTTITLNFPYT